MIFLVNGEPLGVNGLIKVNAGIVMEVQLYLKSTMTFHTAKLHNINPKELDNKEDKFIITMLTPFSLANASFCLLRSRRRTFAF